MRPSESCILLKKLGKSLRDVRLKRRLSQYELADLARIDRSFLAEVENGKVNITVKFLRKVARALKIKVGRLTKDL